MAKKIGDTFGYYTVIDKFKDGSKYKLIMKCSCGTKRTVRQDYLNDPRAKNHCGCMDIRIKDSVYIGAKFERLEVISDHFWKNKSLFVKCKCICGKTGEYRVYGLTNGDTTSCGCYNLEILNARSGKMHPLYDHGDSNTREYHIWSGLKNNEWKYCDFKEWYIKNYKTGLTVCKKNDMLPHNKNNSILLSESEKSRKYSFHDIVDIDGMTPRDFAKQKGIAQTTVYKWHKIHGGDIKNINVKTTCIEQQIELWLKSQKIKFIHNKKLGPYRPDFRLNNIIIECDGLYWHSDAVIQDKKYHQHKRQEYLNLGYTPLFFREDELSNNFNIVKSIISNKLKLNQNRIFARKCDILELDKSVTKHFLNDNHLMGVGRGKSLGLIYNSEVLAIIQYFIKDNITEISRFCTKINTSVIGGFSKLLKKIPHPISTFIDLRYGTGDYLENLGFIKESENISFRWTNNKMESYHRLKFPGNSGYKNGMWKIWDCGQAKYIKYD